MSAPCALTCWPSNATAVPATRHWLSNILARVEHAERLLPVNPLRQYGLERLIAEAQTNAARLVPAGALEWLPDVQKCFSGLAA